MVSRGEEIDFDCKDMANGKPPPSTSLRLEFTGLRDMLLPQA
jgi:hypothetical protein